MRYYHIPSQSRILADILDIDEILVDQKNVPSGSIFVDDIFDSGSTFKKIIGKTSNILDGTRPPLETVDML